MDELNLKTKTVSHSELFVSGVPHAEFKLVNSNLTNFIPVSAYYPKDKNILPGQVIYIVKQPDCLFKVEQAVEVEGIDYEAFDVENIHVGQRTQYISARSMTDVLKLIRRHEDLPLGDKRLSHQYVALDTCDFLLSIIMCIKNISDQAQRFAVVLKGKAIY